MSTIDNGASFDMDAPLNELRAYRRRLKGINRSDLSPDARRDWAQQLQEVSLAISTLETANLQSLSAEFIASGPRLSEATTKLKDDLSQLTDAVAVINATSGTLRTITEIVSLLA